MQWWWGCCFYQAEGIVHSLFNKHKDRVYYKQSVQHVQGESGRKRGLDKIFCIDAKTKTKTPSKASSMSHDLYLKWRLLGKVSRDKWVGRLAQVAVTCLSCCRCQPQAGLLRHLIEHRLQSHPCAVQQLPMVRVMKKCIISYVGGHSWMLNTEVPIQSLAGRTIWTMVENQKMCRAWRVRSSARKVPIMGVTAQPI